MSVYDTKEKELTALQRRAKKDGTFQVRKFDEIQPMELGFAAISIMFDLDDVVNVFKTTKSTISSGSQVGTQGAQVGTQTGAQAAQRAKVIARLKTSAMVGLQIAIGFALFFGLGQHEDMEASEIATESAAIVGAALFSLALLALGPVGWIIAIISIIGSIIDLFFNPFAVMKNRDLNRIRKSYIEAYMDAFIKNGLFYPHIVSPNYLDVDDNRELPPTTQKLFFEYFNEWLRLNGYINQSDMNQILNENMRKSRRLEQRVQFLSSIQDSSVIPIRVIDKSVLLISGFAEDDIDNYAILMSLVARRKKFELEATRSKEYEFFVKIMSNGHFITKLSVNLIFYFCLTLILLY
jgi:hypothetical protein